MYSNTKYPNAVKIKQKVSEIKTQKLYSLNFKPSTIDMNILEEEISIGDTTGKKIIGITISLALVWYATDEIIKPADERAQLFKRIIINDIKSKLLVFIL